MTHSLRVCIIRFTTRQNISWYDSFTACVYANICYKTKSCLAWLFHGMRAKRFMKAIFPDLTHSLRVCLIRFRTIQNLSWPDSFALWEQMDEKESSGPVSMLTQCWMTSRSRLTLLHTPYHPHSPRLFLPCSLPPFTTSCFWCIVSCTFFSLFHAESVSHLVTRSVTRPFRSLHSCSLHAYSLVSSIGSRLYLYRAH